VTDATHTAVMVWAGGEAPIRSPIRLPHRCRPYQRVALGLGQGVEALKTSRREFGIPESSATRWIVPDS
jgi:hypothetical protein